MLTLEFQMGFVLHFHDHRHHGASDSTDIAAPGPHENLHAARWELLGPTR